MIAIVLTVPCSALRAQTQTQTGAGDTVAGRVTGPDSAGLKGAMVRVLALPDSETKATPTDAQGQFKLVFDRPASTYLVTVTMIGYAPARRGLRHPADGAPSATIETSFVLTRAVQQLSRVQTVATHPVPRPDMGDVLQPGETGAVIDPNAVPNGDPSGDLTAALSMIPGLTVTPNADGSLDISYAGLSSDQNVVALNGMNGADNVPRDGPLLRVLTSSYDPSKGGFAGIQANYIVPPKVFGNLATRTIHASLDAPPLEWTTPNAERINPPYTRGIISGQFSNPFGKTGRGGPMQNTMFQFTRQTSDLISLNSETPAALSAIGVAPDSVVRLLATAGRLGIPITGAELPGERTSTSGSVMSRIDIISGGSPTYAPGADGRIPTNTPASSTGAVPASFYIVIGGNWNDNQALGAGPTALSLHTADSRRMSGTLQANSAVQIGKAMNQLSSMLDIAHSHSSPYADLPGASVLLQSTLPNGQTAYSALQGAGAGTGPSQSENWSWEAIDKLKWMTFDGQHQFQLSVDGTLDHYSISQSPSYGTYVYSSLSDFAQNLPESFSRTLGAESSAGNGVHGALGLADTYSPQRFPSLATQYGVRIEDYGYSMQPAFNPAVESLFGLNTDHLPSMLTISPMAGFTWSYANLANGRPDTRRRLIGGIRDYRGVLSTQSLDPYLRSTGLPSAIEQVQCVGSAVPIPDWQTFASSSAAIPDACADGSGAAAFSAVSPVVSVFAPNYAPSHSIRSDLTWMTPIGQRLSVSVHGMEGINRDLPESYDVNFSGVTRFTLPDEAGRPVYAQPANIVTTTGAVAPSDSRLTPQFGGVNERRSDARGYSTLVTTQLNYQPQYNSSSTTPSIPFSIAYTYTRNTVLGNDFGGTTAGDPRLESWNSGAGGRHSILLSGTLRVPTWITISGGLRVQSGMAFTPRVNGDINGDGLANDRAFVFNPATAGDPALATPMQNLLAAAPSWARECLRSQLGEIAGANSCTGPWSATLNLAAGLDAYRIGFRNRGTVSLQLNNALGALDQALHGDSHLHGWGQMGFVDPTLLDVRGFDASAHQYIYDVNPQFGSTTVNRAYRAPFSIVLDVKLDLGDNHEMLFLDGVLHSYVSDTTLDQRDIKERLMRNSGGSPLSEVIAGREALSVSADQAATLAGGVSRYTTLRDSVYTNFAAYLYRSRRGYDEGEAVQQWHDGQAAIVEAQWDAGQLLQRTLSPSQMQKALSGVIKPDGGYWLYDRAMLKRVVEGRLTALH